MPVPDQPTESENASTGDRTESEVASAILASVKEQVGRVGSESLVLSWVGHVLVGHAGSLSTFAILMFVSGFLALLRPREMKRAMRTKTVLEAIYFYICDLNILRFIFK